MIRKWTIKKLTEAKTLFNSLKIDPSSVLFLEERIDSRLLKKLKNSKCLKEFFRILE